MPLRAKEPMRNKAGAVPVRASVAYRAGQLMVTLYSIDTSMVWHFNANKQIELRKFFPKEDRQRLHELLPAMLMELMLISGEACVLRNGVHRTPTFQQP